MMMTMMMIDDRLMIMMIDGCWIMKCEVVVIITMVIDVRFSCNHHHHCYHYYHHNQLLLSHLQAQFVIGLLSQLSLTGI